MRIFRFLALALLALCSSVCLAQQLKISEQNGHISPFRAKITFDDGRTRDVVISAMGAEAGNNFFTHAFFVRTEGGASKRTVWIDQIAAIRGLNPRSRNQFTIQLKDGTSFDAVYVAWMCQNHTELEKESDACSFLLIRNPDESTEIIDMRRLKSIEFLSPARRDKAGNFMFDTWHFSPFTGEKLP
jgi:hypothetical protein